MPRTIALSFALALLAIVAAPMIGRADIPPESVEVCRGVAPGGACQLDGKTGHCGDGTCSRARPDGESTYSCFKCLDGAPATKSGCAAGPGAGLAGAVGVLGLLALRRRAVG